jgi:hypothetical protein
MEPLGHRTTGIIALAVVLAMLGTGFTLTKMADNCPRVHCGIHGQTVTCVPETGKAA